MIVKQLSIFLENKTGRLADFTQVLSAAEINISALSIADTESYGVIRAIVDKPDEAFLALKESGMSAHFTDVLNIAIPDEPGSLSKILKYLSDEGINVSYMYGYSRGNVAYMIIKADNPQKAATILTNHGVESASN